MFYPSQVFWVGAQRPCPDGAEQRGSGIWARNRSGPPGGRS